MKRRMSSRRGCLRSLVIAVLAAVVLLYVGLPAGMAVVAVWPSRAAVGAAPDGFETVTLTAADGVTLQAWYHPGENGAAIIVLHGAGNSRAAVRAHIQMLARRGFGVLALDTRGHGESAGRTNRFGWQGTLDVGAGVAFLEAQPDVQAIGGLGLSMGGEILLGAASTYPQIAAIVAEGATQRSVPEMMALESERPLVRNFVPRVMQATVTLLTGQRPPLPLLESMAAAKETRFLLIAGGAVEREISYNGQFAATVGPRAELWIAPETPHTAALRHYPEEYEQRVVGFFEAVLR